MYYISFMIRNSCKEICFCSANTCNIEVCNSSVSCHRKLAHD